MKPKKNKSVSFYQLTDNGKLIQFKSILSLFFNDSVIFKFVRMEKDFRGEDPTMNLNVFIEFIASSGVNSLPFSTCYYSSENRFHLNMMDLNGLNKNTIYPLYKNFSDFENSFNKVIDDYNIRDYFDETKSPKLLFHCSRSFDINDVFDKKSGHINQNAVIKYNFMCFLVNDLDTFLSVKCTYSIKTGESTVKVTGTIPKSTMKNGEEKRYMKYINIKGKSYYEMIENFFYETIFKEQYKIKKRTHAELDLVKILQF